MTMEWIALIVGCTAAISQTVGTKAADPNKLDVDLRGAFKRYKLPVKRQGGRGTCSVFAVTAALEYALAEKTNKPKQLSEEFLNWASNKTIHRNDDGGFFSDLWKGYVRYGICELSELPYRDKFDPDLQPSPEAMATAETIRQESLKLNWIKPWNVNTGLTETEFDRIKTTLKEGTPVCAGLRWPKSPAWDNHILGMCPADEVFDGHSILLLGYRDDPSLPGGGVFWFRNSGGPEDESAMPYAFALAYTNDAAFVSYGKD